MKNFKRTMAFFMAVICLSLLWLSSCGSLETTSQIEVVDNKNSYTEEEKENALQVVYSLVYKIAESSLIMTNSNKEKVQKLSDRIVSAVCEHPIENEKFDEFFTYLETNTSELFQAYKTLKNENSEKEKKENASSLLVSFYKKALSTFGVQVCAEVAYTYLLSEIENEKDTYNEYVKKYYKEGKTELYNLYKTRYDISKQEYSVFEALGSERFSILVKDCVFFLNLLKLNWQNGLTELTEDFTSAEFILFYKEMDFNISLTEEEWKVLFSRLSEISGDIGEFIKIVTDNENEAEIGNALNTLFALLKELQTTLQEATIDALMQGGDEVCEALVLALNESEKAKVRTILSLSLPSQDYTEYLANYEWGENILSATPLDFDTFVTLEKTEKTNSVLGLVRRIFYVET